MRRSDELTKQIIDGLSELILDKLKSLSDEECHPVCHPDASDDLIKTLRKQVVKLRDIRIAFEDLITNTEV